MRAIALVLSFILLASQAVTADLILIQEQEQQHPGGVSRLKMIVKIKGEKVRTDHFLGDTPVSSSITDHSSGKTIALMHNNKTYNAFTQSEQKESLEKVMAGLQEQNKIPAKRPTLKATGEHQTINGWKADKYVATTNDSKMTYWIAKELQPYQLLVQKAMRNPMFAEMEKQFPDPALFPGMPVLTILEQSFGGMQTKTTIRTVSIKEDNIPDSEFSIPKDYKKQ